jgi:hypothetical protein
MGTAMSIGALNIALLGAQTRATGSMGFLVIWFPSGLTLRRWSRRVPTGVARNCQSKYQFYDAS